MALELVWKRPLPFNFLSLAVGTPFSAKSCQILVGGEDGVVRMYTGPTEPPVLFETKGSAVCQLLLHNITKLHTTDLIVGDSNGSVCVFSKEQLLTRARLPYCVTALTVFTDGAHNNSIVAGDVGGIAVGFLPFEQHWRVNLQDHGTHGHLDTAYTPTVKALLNIVLKDDFGCPTHYVAVADGSQYIHLFQGGKCVLSIPVPCGPTAMCSGTFILEDGEEGPQSGEGGTSGTQDHGRPMQIAFAGDDGTIYLVHNYQVYVYGKIGYPIRHLVSVPRTDGVDLVVCAGCFDGVRVLDQGKIVEASNPCREWVQCMALGDVDGDGCPELVLALAGRTLEVHRVGAPQKHKSVAV
eukprot:comp18840_c0_seq1/m.20846 comp18840_c0_seq1/g.20846  ORF comp18840_c0_seq1/g.20846 comp18840_c0_seq1/m.20846 type:complete len:352 (-) comp18840_c0_seq1:262-1317(-)